MTAALVPSWVRCTGFVTIALTLVFGGLIARSANAQCQSQWLPGTGVPGVDGVVYTVVAWDRDGTGPLPATVAIGGVFTIAGDARAINVAAFDPVAGTWSAIGSGISGPSSVVRALAVLPNGDLVAGGLFSIAGGAPINVIARWNGVNWNQLGTGLAGGEVRSLAVKTNGDLVVGGTFTHAGGVLANRVALWDGTSWSPLTSGISGTSASVSALAVMHNGELVVGGTFSTAGGSPVSNIARWDGVGWSGMGSGMNSNVLALIVAPDGDLVAAGGFTTAGGVTANRVARWDGTAWSSLGSGLSTTGRALQLLPGGDIVASETLGIRRWNGTTWTPLGQAFTGGLASVNALAMLPNGDVLAGGSFRLNAGMPVHGLAIWSGTAWLPLADGIWNVSADTSVNDIDAGDDGGLTLGGSFSHVNGQPVRNVAAVTEDQWNGLGAGVFNFPPGSGGQISAVTVLPNGDRIVGGGFNRAGGVTANNVARWDGTSWMSLGTGVGGNLPFVYSLVGLQNGGLIAGGDFTTAGGVQARGIARWDGAEWSSLGTSVNGGVNAVAVLPNGDIVAGGYFTIAGGVIANRIARWNGTDWFPLGNGIGGVSFPAVLSLKVLENGDLAVGGVFDTAGGVTANNVAIWNGVAWIALGTGTAGDVHAIAQLQNGALAVGGSFTAAGSVAANHVAVWDGANWQPLGAGVSADVYDLEVLPSGDLVAGGTFLTAGDVVSTYLAVWGLPPGCRCDPIDFNQDTLFPDTQDIADFIAVFGGGVCGGQQVGDPPCNSDIDFNNDGLFPDTDDIGALLRVFGGGGCAV